MPAGGLMALLRALLVWALFIAAETAQGALRHILLTPDVQLAAREVGVVIGAGLIFALTWAAWRWLGLRRPASAIFVGFLWAGLTAAFDLGLGRALGETWSALLADYDPRRGGAMLLGLALMTLTPLVVWRLRESKRP
ncbi:MAG: hypothetical protein JSR98_08925 [Proteobacteria bacterium]|nr:hypothetical protein [Pseudomonadota bacterium]